MKLLKKILMALKRKKIKKIPLLHQGQAKFRLKYQEKYTFGVGSYGLPVIHDWNEGATLKIGSYCSIATDVQIFLGGHHHSDWISTYPFPAMVEEARNISGYGFSRGDVIVGSDVWLCSNTIILSGVTIGHGAIVAAGAVVSKNVEPYSVVAGNPARHVKWRFDEEIRNALLDVEWWNWSEQEIRNISPMLCGSNICEFLNYAKNREASN
ncbi:MAG: Acetyltransferase (isoleucine patch superfamily)-like protein [Proteobacteria bacterium]|nr:Acetyltransferase (isoleucine patch superfamily)-like protein [Pseudomonadota bacterium]